jgi:NitT/TauT family transport system substrate-binding protein
MKAQQKIVLSPQWTAQAQFAGYYVADAMGFYKKAGLNVIIEHTSVSNSCINRLRSGRSQYITLNLLSALKYVSEGMSLVNVMQSSQQNSLMIVSRYPLNGLESLRGKKIGHWKVGFSELAFSLDHQYKLNIQWIPFLSNINLYISGAIDATLAMNYNEFYQLKEAGLRPKKEQLLYFRDIGYNIPEDGLYVTREYYRTHRQEVEKFAQATRDGWEWAVNHPEETLDIVMQYTRQDGVATNMGAQRWMLSEIFKMLTDIKTGKRTYHLDEKAFEQANRILVENGIIQKSINYKQMTQP